MYIYNITTTMYRFLTCHVQLPSHVQKYSRECLQRSIQRLVEKYDKPNTNTNTNTILPYTETMNFYPHPLFFSFSLLFFTFIYSLKGKK